MVERDTFLRPTVVRGLQNENVFLEDGRLRINVWWQYSNRTIYTVASPNRQDLYVSHITLNQWLCPIHSTIWWWCLASMYVINTCKGCIVGSLVNICQKSWDLSCSHSDDGMVSLCHGYISSCHGNECLLFLYL